MNKKAVFRSVVVSAAFMLSITAGLTTAVYAAPPQKPGDSSEMQFYGAHEFAKTTSEVDSTYESQKKGENAVLVTDGTVNLTRPRITKSGDDSGESADFYGTNAAVLARNSSKIKIMGGEITTDGKYANAVFAYGNATADISDVNIKTSSSNSGALMVTGGGTLNATNVTAETDGESSAPIRSDRGGGTMMIIGGNYKSNGSGSPAIYSTAEVFVKDGAKLESTTSEGVVIEGANSATLDNVELIANNTELHGNSETYKAIFIYQSMSGDADEGTGRFSMKNSRVTNKKGDVFFITNTTADISLSKNVIKNEDSDGVLIRAESGKWGKSGKNGGDFTFTSEYEPLEGDIVVDDISSGKIVFKNRTSYKGTINGKDSADSLSLTLDSKSRIILTGDSYVSSLDNETTDNSNIFSNGYKLYVDGKEVSINKSEPEEWKYDFETETTEPVVVEEPKDKSFLFILLAISGVAFIVAIGSVFMILGKRKKAKQRYAEKEAIKKVNDNNMKKPWEKK